MHRILGIDHGAVRIGVAISDLLGMIAQPVPTIKHTALEGDLDRIAELVAEYEVGEIVVGMPRNMAGEDEGPAAKKVGRFVMALEKKFPELSIKTWDERFSTAEAERSLLASGSRRAKRRQVRDQVAAMLILQGYLDFKSGGLNI